MKSSPRVRTEGILAIMRVLAWVAFIGLLIQAGAILTSYGVSYFNPNAAKNLYKGLDVHHLREISFAYYTVSVSFMVVLSAMKALIVFFIIKALSKVNLMNPFKIEVTHLLEMISYLLAGMWAVTSLNNGYVAWLASDMAIVLSGKPAEEFLFMAGLVFIISQIFKRGVELQSESDLTV